MNLALWSPRMTGYSGVELYTFTLASALARAGHRTSVHAPTWEDHLRLPLLADGVSCGDWDTPPQNVTANISPKFGPLKAAMTTQRPIVQVLHSEHLTDVPIENCNVRGVVMIRAGQRWLIESEGRWAKELPRALIRNPIDFSRLGPATGARPFACCVLSEFDDMKVDLAEEVAKRVDGPVLLVGPWRSEKRIPEHCQHEQPTMDVRGVYARARMAFSYRLSRQLPEAHACRIPVLVRGKLEPELVTRHDQEDDWTTHEVGSVNLAQFDANYVAGQMVDFIRSVL